MTISRAFGRSRRAFRIAWRAWRTASPVTAQVLNTTASVRPSAAACLRMISLSYEFSRQPKVMMSTSSLTADARRSRRRRGPVMITWLSSARHSISSSPPSSSSTAERSVRSRRAAATRAAQAPVPQACVRPAPRSHTRSRMRSRLFTWAKPTLTCSGNSGWRSTTGPASRIGAVPTSSTKNTTWGLPMETAPGAAASAGSSCSTTSSARVSCAASRGISAQSRRGLPMSTLTSRSPPGWPPGGRPWSRGSPGPCRWPASAASRRSACRCRRPRSPRRRRSRSARGHRRLRPRPEARWR